MASPKKKTIPISQLLRENPNDFPITQARYESLLRGRNSNQVNKHFSNVLTDLASSELKLKEAKSTMNPLFRPVEGTMVIPTTSKQTMGGKSRKKVTMALPTKAPTPSAPQKTKTQPGILERLSGVWNTTQQEDSTDDESEEPTRNNRTNNNNNNNNNEKKPTMDEEHIVQIQQQPFGFKLPFSGGQDMTKSVARVDAIPGYAPTEQTLIQKNIQEKLQKIDKVNESVSGLKDQVKYVTSKVDDGFTHVQNGMAHQLRQTGENIGKSTNRTSHRINGQSADLGVHQLRDNLLKLTHSLGQKFDAHHQSADIRELRKNMGEQREQQYQKLRDHEEFNTLQQIKRNMMKMNQRISSLPQDEKKDRDLEKLRNTMTQIDKEIATMKTAMMYDREMDRTALFFNRELNRKENDLKMRSKINRLSESVDKELSRPREPLYLTQVTHQNQYSPQSQVSRNPQTTVAESVPHVESSPLLFSNPISRSNPYVRSNPHLESDTRLESDSHTERNPIYDINKRFQYDQGPKILDTSTKVLDAKRGGVFGDSVVVPNTRVSPYSYQLNPAPFQMRGLPTQSFAERTKEQAHYSPATYSKGEPKRIDYRYSNYYVNNNKIYYPYGSIEARDMEHMRDMGGARHPHVFKRMKEHIPRAVVDQVYDKVVKKFLKSEKYDERDRMMSPLLKPQVRPYYDSYVHPRVKKYIYRNHIKPIFRHFRPKKRDMKPIVRRSVIDRSYVHVSPTRSGIQRSAITLGGSPQFSRMAPEEEEGPLPEPRYPLIPKYGVYKDYSSNFVPDYSSQRFQTNTVPQLRQGIMNTPVKKTTQDMYTNRATLASLGVPNDNGSASFLVSGIENNSHDVL